MAEVTELAHVPARDAREPGHEHDALALEVRDLWAGYPGMPPAIEAVSFVVPEASWSVSSVRTARASRRYSKRSSGWSHRFAARSECSDAP